MGCGKLSLSAVGAMVALSLLAGIAQAAQQGSDTGSASTGGSPPSSDPGWQSYGNVLRGSSYYGSKAFLGLAAKGNIVIGNYATWDDAPNHPVYEMIDRDGAADVSYPHMLPDITDAGLGYNNDPSGAQCAGRTPCFNGNYTAFDGGARCSGSGGSCGAPTPRRFYESSLSDAKFQSLVQSGGAGDLLNPHACFGGESGPACAGDHLHIMATLFTNHGLIGDVGRSVWLGSVAARDDAMRFQGRLDMMYDWRLQDDNFSKSMSLPLQLEMPTVIDWQECPDSGCS